MIGIYAGSFDPVTNGHIDIIERASRLVDQLIVAVLINQAKRPAFSLEDRCSLLAESTKNLPNVEIDSFDGLLVEYAKLRQADILIRGIRTVADYEVECNMAHANKILSAGLETIVLFSNPKWSYLSSSMVREIAHYGGDISLLVPACSIERVNSISIRNKEIRRQK